MDTTNTQQMQQLGFAVIGVSILFGLILTAVFIWMYWRTLSKAGFSGALSLLALVPGVGFIIPLAILAFGEWKVVPAPTASPYFPPSYPPPPPPAYQPPPQP